MVSETHAAYKELSYTTNKLWGYAAQVSEELLWELFVQAGPVGE